jgi:hypothetical protein
MEELLEQLARARAALRRGRARAPRPHAPAEPPFTAAAPLPEALLARLYVDPRARAEALADARGFASRSGLSGAQAEALAGMDRAGLALAAASFARKRAARH